MIGKHSMRSTARLTKEAARAGLKLNPRKCKALRTEYAINRESSVVDGEEVEDVEELPYQGATVEKRRAETITVLRKRSRRIEVHSGD